MNKIGEESETNVLLLIGELDLEKCLKSHYFHRFF